ncbi:MAG: hypothetical protein NVSMB29_14510 [Candidatus Dormibacteria bacterium]
MHEVQAGDPAVDHPVLDVLRYVIGANEENVNRGVPAVRGQCLLARLLGRQPRRLEESPGRSAQPALRGNGNGQAVAALRVAGPRSAAR